MVMENWKKEHSDTGMLVFSYFLLLTVVTVVLNRI